jgi:putative phosphoesterase
VQLLVAQGVDTLIHLGDICSDDVIDALAVVDPQTGKQIQAHLVFGNNDMDIRSSGTYASSLGIWDQHPVGRIVLERGELVFMHGDDHKAMQRAIKSGVRYLCHGHTHTQIDIGSGTTRVINPGALHRASQYSVAVLDTKKDELTFHIVRD